MPPPCSPPASLPPAPPPPSATSEPLPSGLDVAELSATDASASSPSGELSSHALTQAYLDRIAAIDKSGPTLNSVIELNPDALQEADALDAERKAGKLRGPLHGLPVLLKDNIDATGMANSAGSLALADNRPSKDAFIVARLRAAGAVILGKTNLSEWANFRSTRSTFGLEFTRRTDPECLRARPQSLRIQLRHRHGDRRQSRGVRRRHGNRWQHHLSGSVSGLVGLKPTVGLVSRNGIIPISISQDTAGPMGRSVADVAVLLNAMAGVDEADPSGARRRRQHSRGLFDVPQDPMR